MKAKKIIIKILFFALIFITLINCIEIKGINNVINYDKSTNSLSTISGKMSASFSEDGGSSVTLTSDTVVNGWDYDNIGTLNISLEELNINVVYKLIITMDNCLYLPVEVIPSPNGSTIDFKKNESIVVNGNKTYEGMPYSGTITYTFNNGSAKTIEIENFELEFKYDDVYWNDFANASLGNGVDPLLTVQLVAEDTEILDERNILNIITGKKNNYFYNSSFVYKNIGSDSFEARPNETMTFYFGQDSQYAFTGQYFKQINIELEIPKYSKDGNTYYLEYDPNNIGIYIKSGVALNKSYYDITATNEKIYIELNDFYHQSSTILNLKLNFPQAEELLSVSGLYVFKGSSKAYINGDTSQLLYSDKFNITLNTNKESQIGIFNRGWTTDYRNDSVVQPLGGLGLINKGADSGKIKLQYDFDTILNDDVALLVSTIRLMPDNVSKIFTIKYSLVNDKGEIQYFDSTGEIVNKNTPDATPYWTVEISNKYYGKTLTYSNSILFNRSMIFEKHRQENLYFKTIEYELGVILSGQTLWHSGANFSYDSSSGTFWGYIKANGVDKKAISNVKVYEKDNNGYYQLLHDVNITTGTKIDDAISYGMANASVSNNTVNAGDSFVISGQIRTVAYPYSANSVLNTEDNPVIIGLKLPEGVKINKSGSLFTNKFGTVNIEIASITSESLGDGYNLWRIELKGGYIVGYCSETLGAISNGAYINFNIECSTELITSGTSLFIRNSVFCAAKDIRNGSSGTYATQSVVDSFDLNSNGSTADKIGCFDDDFESLKIQIIGKDAKLDIYDSVKINGVGRSADLDTSVYNEIVSYELNINCIDGGLAEDFAYYIPIIKEDSIVDNELIFSAQYSYVLSQEPEVINSIQNGGVKVLYTFDKNITYNTVGSATWYETIPDNKTLEEVTFIKVVSQKDIIENGSESVVSLTMVYDGDEEDYISNVGMQNSWSSRGQYKYKLGDRGTSGHYSTTINSININYTFDKQIIELTTSTGDHSDNEGNDSYIIDTLTSFKNEQTYKIVSVTTYNTLLTSVSYMEANASLLTGDEANRTFAFYVTLDANEKKDVTVSENLLGTVGELQEYKLKFEIFNADVISDITTIRYIEIIIESDNGVTIPVRINIKRTLTVIGTVSNSISAGKQYALFGTTDTSVIISKDSAFTAQFSAENIIPDNYKERKLLFTKALPEGTTIVFIDLTESTNIKYYYYEVGSLESKEISLTKFNVMGKSEKYSALTGTTAITEKYLFIIDMADENTLAHGSENSINLIRTLNSGEEKSATALTFKTNEIRTYELEGTDNKEVGEEIEIEYTISEISYSDSKYNDRKLSLIITPTSTLSVNDASIKYNGETYYLNRNKEFIIPLNDVQISGTNKIKFIFNSKTITENEGTCTLNIKLKASATASADKPHLGNELKEINLTLKTNPKTSFKVESMSDRWIDKEELKKTIEIKYNIEGVVNKVTIELQTKIGEGYATDSTLLEAVNGSTTQSSGQFIVTGKTTLTLKFSELMPVGNYQLLFTVYDNEGNKVITIPYKFIVME